MSGISTVEIDGRELQVRREFAIAARIEERFGPLAALIERMQKLHLTLREIADLYEIALAGHDNPPDRDVIERHVMKSGAARACAPLVNLVSALFLGEERFEAMRRREEARNGAADPTTAASRGAN